MDRLWPSHKYCIPAILSLPRSHLPRVFAYSVKPGGQHFKDGASMLPVVVGIVYKNGGDNIRLFGVDVLEHIRGAGEVKEVEQVVFAVVYVICCELYVYVYAQPYKVHCGCKHLHGIAAGGCVER